MKADMGGPQALLKIGQSVLRIVDMIAKRSGSGGVTFVDYDDGDVAW